MKRQWAYSLVASSFLLCAPLTLNARQPKAPNPCRDLERDFDDQVNTLHKRLDAELSQCRQNNGKDSDVCRSMKDYNKLELRALRDRRRDAIDSCRGPVSRVVAVPARSNESCDRYDRNHDKYARDKYPPYNEPPYTEPPPKGPPPKHPPVGHNPPDGDGKHHHDPDAGPTRNAGNSGSSSSHSGGSSDSNSGSSSGSGGGSGSSYHGSSGSSSSSSSGSSGGGGHSASSGSPGGGWSGGSSSSGSSSGGSSSSNSSSSSSHESGGRPK